jgi:hypothetical protein
VIKEVYAESLAAIHLDEAVENSKVRSEVLKALNAPGYETKKPKIETQNNLTINATQGLAGLMSSLTEVDSTVVDEPKPEA